MIIKKSCYLIPIRTGSGMLLLLWLLLVPKCFGVDEDKGLAPVFAHEVDRRLDVPDRDQRSYGNLMITLLADRVIDRAQYLVVVDRDTFTQAAMLFWITPEHTFKFIGASPISTGKPGRFDHFKTPLGMFEHTTDNPDFRAEGTKNELGFRGYGREGSRIYDFGWQQAERGWGKGGESQIRLQMHSTDQDRLEIREGSAQSKGCIRIPATLNSFIDQHGILDQDYDEAMTQGKTFPVISKTRGATPFAGKFLIVVDSKRSERPAWSPGPLKQAP